MAVLSELPAPSRDAEHRGAKRGARRDCLSTGTCEFAPARLARNAMGGRANRTLARPSCPAPMVLATFAETKVARSPGRRTEKDMDVVLANAKAAHFVRDPSSGASRRLLPQGEKGKRAIRSRAGALLQKLRRGDSPHSAKRWRAWLPSPASGGRNGYPASADELPPASAMRICRRRSR